MIYYHAKPHRACAMPIKWGRKLFLAQLFWKEFLQDIHWRKWMDMHKGLTNNTRLGPWWRNLHFSFYEDLQSMAFQNSNLKWMKMNIWHIHKIVEMFIDDCYFKCLHLSRGSLKNTWVTKRDNLEYHRMFNIKLRVLVFVLENIFLALCLLY